MGAQLNDHEILLKAKGGRYVDRLIAKHEQGIKSFIHAAEDPEDRILRLQSVLHATSYLKTKAAMWCSGAGIPSFNIAQSESGAILHAADHQEHEVMKQKVKRELNLGGGTT